jgi:hypothetical protein
VDKRTRSTSPTVTADASTSTAASAKRSRRRGPTSKVWLHFEEVTQKQGGKEVRISAICLHCKHTMSAKSSYGTGHLIRHLELCPAKKEKEKSVDLNPYLSLMLMDLLCTRSTLHLLQGLSFVI